jgi:peptidoglycan LD-endopeptidase CwlK
VANMHMERLNGLQPKAKEQASAAFKQAETEKVGVFLVPKGGLRTYKEQNDLYAQGRTKPGKVVTNAKGGYSYHNFGLAFDFCVLSDGKAVWNSNHPHWKRFVQIAKAHGFDWGGDFKSPDAPHFQITKAPSLATLRQRYPGGYKP